MRFGLFCIFILLCICSLLLGAEQIQWSTLFSFSHESWLTLTASRIPRLITIVLTGIGLAVCGVILQHIVRNKFVEPETSGGLDAAKLGILVSLTLVPCNQHAEQDDICDHFLFYCQFNLYRNYSADPF